MRHRMELSGCADRRARDDGSNSFSTASKSRLVRLVRSVCLTSLAGVLLTHLTIVARGDEQLLSLPSSKSFQRSNTPSSSEAPKLGTDSNAATDNGDSTASSSGSDRSLSLETDGSIPNPKADIEDVLFKDLPAATVSSATKMAQPITEAPSAITVITWEDIRRMGARRLIDVFRWTPGLDVFAITGNSSSVSARGVYSLHNQYINEMLVLIDGRSVYVDFLGGVDWDTLPVMLEEIERIEVIRGPSGSLYGPNAFAGTISIFTKRNPESTILRTTVGNKHFFESNMVHWLEGDSYRLRLGIGWHENEGFGSGNGRDYRDDLNLLKMNMYSRFMLDDDTDLELRGGWVTGSRGFDAFANFANGREETDVSYGQIHFEHRFSEDSSFRAQYFHNHFNFDRLFLNGTRGFETWTDVVTIEQYVRIHPSHRLIFGGEFRNFVGHSGITNPDRIEENFRSLYIEDSVTLIENKLQFIGGLRYDDFTVSGDDFSPRAALVWTPAPKHSFRASVARSVATPMTVASFFDFTIPVGTTNVGPPFGVVPIIAQNVGNPSLNPESIAAYELGYRGRWSRALDVGVDLFIYDVVDLMRVRFGDPVFNPLIPAIVTSNTFGNDVDSLSYGGEMSVGYRWSDCLRTFSGYAYKEIPDLTTNGPFNGLENFKNSLFGGFDWQFACDWICSGRLAWNDGFDIDVTSINDYWRYDMRIARTILDGCGTIELIRQNLLDPRHPESDSRAEVPRTVFLAIELRF